MTTKSTSSQCCGFLCRSRYSDFMPEGMKPYQRNLLCSATGNLIDREKGWACNNKLPDLGTPHSYVQCPSSHLNRCLCSSAEPVRCRRETLTKEFSGVQICLFQILRWGVLLALNPDFSCPDKEMNHSPTHCEVPAGLIWPERLATTPESSAAQ